MYGLPPDTDLDFLLDRRLEQICIGPNQTFLHFDDQVVIGMECDFVYSEQDEQAWGTGSNPVSIASLIPLLGGRVLDVVNKGDGELELMFTGERCLNLFDSEVSYESYTITGPGQTIVV